MCWPLHPCPGAAFTERLVQAIANAQRRCSRDAGKQEICEMWISNVQIVLPEAVLPQGALWIENGRIAELRDTPVAGAHIDGQGLFLMPGLIDMHGDMIEHAVAPRTGADMPMELALRNLDRLLTVAGVTTAYAAVSFHPKMRQEQMRSYERSKVMLKALQDMRPELSVDHKAHARFEVDFPRAFEIVEELVGAGLIDLVSLMDHTPGQGQVRDLERLVRVRLDAGMSRGCRRSRHRARYRGTQVRGRRRAGDAYEGHRGL